MQGCRRVNALRLKLWIALAFVLMIVAIPGVIASHALKVVRAQYSRAEASSQSLSAYQRLAVLGYTLHQERAVDPAAFQRDIKLYVDGVRSHVLNAERYITEELKAYESKILGAEEKIHQIETQLFEQLVSWISTYIKQVQLNANLIGQLDCLISFAQLAIENDYVCPILNENHELEITNGRHPVIEKQLPVGIPYVPNDVFLDRESQQIIMITGPNMSGKSAILRQTALIVLLAQMGSFVPAEKVRMGIVDKIFTRVGASDNISMGESTFMVEMTEAANILHNATPRSLVLMDEIGRGTSTFDGLSLAWATARHLAVEVGAFTLFATHYFELTTLAAELPRVANVHLDATEHRDGIVFMHAVKPGPANRSYGLAVAKLAGVPREVIGEARKYLAALESQAARSGLAGPQTELAFETPDDGVAKDILKRLSETDLDALSPREAQQLLYELRELSTRA